MKKETIEYFRDKKCIKGYGYITEPKQLNEISILNYLCEWSKNKKIKIYSHSLRKEEENIGKYGDYFMDGGKKQYGKELGPTMNIAYCDWVYYLDIYYQ